MSLLGAALAAMVLSQDPAPTTTLAERVAAEHARNATLPPFVPTTLPRIAPTPKVVPSASDEDCGCIARIKLPTIDSNHPDYPDKLLQLAAHFARKQQDHLAHVAELDADIAASNHHIRTDQLRARQAKARAQAHEAHEQMLKILKVLVSTPSYKPGRAIEEGLYLYSQELHILGREREGKDAAIRVIQEYPKGRYASRAYAMFGLYYLTKHKLSDVRGLFEHVLAAPVHDPDADTASHLGLGWSYLRSEAGEAPRPDLALAAFTQVIETTSQDHDILRSAHDGLVHSFAAAGKPSRAAALFTRLAALPQPVDRRDITLLERLALAYFARGQHRESAVIYRDLQRLYPSDPQACTWQTRLLLTAVAAHDHNAEQREALRLADTWRTLRDEQRHPKPIREQCRDDARDALIDLTNQRPPDDPSRPALCAVHRDLFPKSPPLCTTP